MQLRITLTKQLTNEIRTEDRKECMQELNKILRAALKIAKLNGIPIFSGRCDVSFICVENEFESFKWRSRK